MRSSAFLATTVFLACAPPAPPCSSATCPGCCSATGTCNPGKTTDACGNAGETCHACAVGQVCQLGLCVGGSSGTGGGAASGGGTAAGGGSGTGGGFATGGGGSAMGGGSDGGAGCIPGVPHVMLVLDTSGSMSLPVDSACDSGACTTRLQAVQSAFDSFFSQMTSTPTANMALWTFPDDFACAVGASRVTFANPETSGDLMLQANLLHQQFNQLTAKGGTPTSATLTAVGHSAGFQNGTMPRLVVLVTDGVPNCNINNPNTCVDPVACQCTITPCPTTQTANDSNYCVRGCLDQDATVFAVQALSAEGIATLVIGVGADVTSGAGPLVLQQMAAMGGVTRQCSSAADCNPGDSCMGGRCSSAAYLVSGAADLAAVLGGPATSLIGRLAACAPP
jgi:hypothetical protein